MSKVEPGLARRRGSAATRRRIADAALDLFSARGYAATSLQAIADAASLHVQTIYQAFGSKPAVLEAACELARAGDDDPETAPSEWPWAQALVGEPDPVKLIRRYATHVRTIAPRAGPLVAEIRNAARADPELAIFLAHIEAGRYLGPAGVVALLTEKKSLRRGLDADRAAETMFAVSSYESYELLVVDRHRTPDEYERWLGDILCDLLLEPINTGDVGRATDSRAPRRNTPKPQRT
jgi:AcrR family transcriptional regulator